jgi:hypothetical protein
MLLVMEIELPDNDDGALMGDFVGLPDDDDMVDGALDGLAKGAPKAKAVSKAVRGKAKGAMKKPWNQKKPRATQSPAVRGNKLLSPTTQAAHVFWDAHRLTPAGQDLKQKIQSWVGEFLPCPTKLFLIFLEHVVCNFGFCLTSPNCFLRLVI